MGIRFFEKNKIDLTFDNVAITVTDLVATDSGQAFVNLMRNRRNDSGWTTTDSTDAANTELIFDFGDLVEINRIFLIQHNLKAYTIQYWDGAAYQNFSTPISETNNSAVDKLHEFNNVETSRVKLVITGTMVADDDKFISQFVATQEIGQFQVMQPRIEDARVSRNRKVLKSLSGKAKIMRSSGFIEFKFSQTGVTNDNDLTLLETLHDYYDGFLVWISGGDVSQFRNERIAYRLKDLIFMNITTEYQPEWKNGFYNQGIDVKFNMTEVL
jgi:hypothetical protein